MNVRINIRAQYIRIFEYIRHTLVAPFSTLELVAVGGTDRIFVVALAHDIGVFKLQHRQ